MSYKEEGLNFSQYNKLNDYTNGIILSLLLGLKRLSIRNRSRPMDGSFLISFSLLHLIRNAYCRSGEWHLKHFNKKVLHNRTGISDNEGNRNQEPAWTYPAPLTQLDPNGAI